MSTSGPEGQKATLYERGSVTAHVKIYPCNVLGQASCVFF